MIVTFYAVATRKNRVRVVFSEPMAQNEYLEESLQYVVSDIGGSPVSVVTAAVEQASSVRSTVLELGTDLVAGKLYQVKLLDGIVSEAEQQPVSHDTAVLQWTENILRAEIPIAHFSGEVVGGLYGTHKSLVFFSPALESPASNSIIEIEQVDVCSRAYDEYRFPPQSEGSRVLMTHGAGVVPTPVVTTLNSTDVLWQSASRVDTRFELEVALSEAVPPPVDGPATATVVSWPPGRIALLNNPGWKLRDNLATPPIYFITADNLTPIVMLPPVTITL